MKIYYDSGILLKLYTEETESAAVRRFVTQQRPPILINSAHLAECTSALRLKQFRGEGHPDQVAQALRHLQEDLQRGVLKKLTVDWDHAWEKCRLLSEAYAGTVGCRTLDTLHVACARLTGADVLVTSDRRQLALARLAGLQVSTPS